MTDFEKQMAFIMELDKIKKITRQTYLSDGSRKENDAEHSWHLALMAFVFADYANEKIDVLKTMKMVLLHDVIEIDAGDTYAYDTEGNKTKRVRELKAADRQCAGQGTAASSEQCFGRQILGGARRQGVSGACAQQQNT